MSINLPNVSMCCGSNTDNYLRSLIKLNAFCTTLFKKFAHRASSVLLEFILLVLVQVRSLRKVIQGTNGKISSGP